MTSQDPRLLGDDKMGLWKVVYGEYWLKMLKYQLSEIY